MSGLEHEIARLRGELLSLLQLTRRIGAELGNVLQAIANDAERLADDRSQEARAASQKILSSTARGGDLSRALLSAGTEVDGPAPAPARQQESPASPRPGRSARILVVDDQEPLRSLTQSVLVKAGYDVVVAANGAEAVEVVRETNFDLILMDVQMPIMDGQAAARSIREFEGPRSRVPIVALSGNAPPSQMQSSGIDDWLGKPFKRDVLLEKVNLWLNRSANAGPAVTPRQTADATAFQEVSDLMGRPWVMSALARFIGQIDEAFDAEPMSPAEVGTLASRAHALSSVAALLGFSVLSQLCGEIEETCKGGRDVRSAFKSAKAAALQARQAASDLVAGHGQ